MQEGTTAELEPDLEVEAPSVESRDPDAAAAPAPSSARSALESLVEFTAPREVDELLGRLLGRTIPRRADGEGFALKACGRFDGSETLDLLAQAQERAWSGAVVLVESDAERVLYFSKGRLVGAGSTVLFERLGRLLYQAGVVTHDSSTTLVDAEEQLGAQALLLWISSQHLSWAVERQAWEVVAAIHFIKRGHFAMVDGEPELDVPGVALEPRMVALEGRRRHEAFRNGPASSEAYHPDSMAAPPPKIATRMRPVEISPETLKVVLGRIRDAEGSAAAD